MKKIFCFSLVLMIIGCFAGCNSMKGYNAYERVYKTYSGMKTFKAAVSVTSFSNNSENKYSINQYYCAPDKQRSEYVSENGDSSVTIICGDKGKLISDSSTTPVNLDKIDRKEKDYLMLNTFFDIFYSSEETAVKTSGSSKKGKLILSAEIGDSNPYKKSAELVIDTETLKPLKMTISGFDGKPSLCIEYNEFELNPELDSKLFE